MATTSIKCPQCGNAFEVQQVDGSLYDVQALEAESHAIHAITDKQWWDPKDVAIYIYRSPWYARRLMSNGTIKRNAQNLTCKLWVDEYLNKTAKKGRLKSSIR